MRNATIVVTAALALACGGGGGGFGSSVGPYATSMGEHYANENPGIPCPTYALGDEIEMNGFSFRIDEVIVADAEKSLPWIANSTERKHFERNEKDKALIIVASARNNNPVKSRFNLSVNTFGTDGEQGSWWAYNEKLVVAERGVDEWDSNLPPNKWMPWIGISNLTDEAADGSILRLYHTEKEYDPTDPRGRRKITVLYEQAVIDLGTPTRGPHINPERRDGNVPAAATTPTRRRK